MKNRSIITLLCLLLVAQLCANDLTFTPKTHNTADDFFTTPLQEIRHIYKIIFVIDAAGKKFVLKYPRSPKHAIDDALGARVGESIGVNINHVKLFPAYDPSLSPVDKFPDQIKTLHTLVPGNEIKKVNKEISFLHYFTIKFGLASKFKLENVAKHIDLFLIMALDIFLNNSDRHNNNLFYDKDNDHFYAIDMDAIFHSKELLATAACDFIKRLHKRKLSRKTKTALKNLYKALQNLITQYPPEKLCELRRSLAEEAQYEYTELEQEQFKNLVECNFNEVERLQRHLKHFLY